MNRSIRNCLVVMIVTLLAAACGDEQSMIGEIAAPTPEPGTLAVTFHSPVSDDGGVSFRLLGEGITDIRATEGVELFVQEAEGGYAVAALGVALSGAVALFDVSDTRDPGAYVVHLEEVAGEDNLPRRDVSRHSITVAKH